MAAASSTVAEPRPPRRCHIASADPEHATDLLEDRVEQAADGTLARPGQRERRNRGGYDDDQGVLGCLAARLRCGGGAGDCWGRHGRTSLVTGLGDRGLRGTVHGTSARMAPATVGTTTSRTNAGRKQRTSGNASRTAARPASASAAIP